MLPEIIDRVNEQYLAEYLGFINYVKGLRNEQISN